MVPRGGRGICSGSTWEEGGGAVMVMHSGYKLFFMFMLYCMLSVCAPVYHLLIVSFLDTGQVMDKAVSRIVQFVVLFFCGGMSEQC